MDYKIKKGNSRAAVTPKSKRLNSELDLLSEMVRVRQETMERTAQLENIVDRIGKEVTPDAYSPSAVAKKAESVGVTKGELNTLSTVLLGILAGVFIGLGAN